MGGADSSTRWRLAAEPMGLAHGGNVVDTTGWVEGRGVTSAFLFIDDDMLVIILMESWALPLYQQTWASR